MDNAFCGGSGATLTGTALAAVKAAIFMGDPHNIAGLPYNVGTCTNKGVSNISPPPLSSSLRSHLILTRCLSVRCPPQRLQVLTRQPGSYPVVLRLDRSLLLQWQRCQLSPAVRQQVRLSGPCLHQEGHWNCLKRHTRLSTSGEKVKTLQSMGSYM
jgi:hypothetical protein